MFSSVKDVIWWGVGGTGCTPTSRVCLAVRGNMVRILFYRILCLSLRM